MGTFSSPLTGLIFGTTGIPKVNLGALELLLLREPGTGGRSRGTGEDDMVRLSCLPWGKNNSFGSAKVASFEDSMLTAGKGGWGNVRVEATGPNCNYYSS